MEWFFSTLLPRQCVLCQKVTSNHLCSQCVLTLPFQRILGVSRQSKHMTVFQSITPSIHEVRFFSHPHLKAVLSLLPYRDPAVKRCIHQFKYKNIPSLHYPLSRILLQSLSHFLGIHQPFLLAPVPLHSRRLMYRGYNQSLLLAEDLAHDLHLPILSELTRERHTAPQMSFAHLHARKANIKNAFRVEPHSHDTSLPVMLVDDVTTSLSTLQECASALNKAGFTDIYAVTLAR